jgi:hypothetical protein
MRRRVGTAGTPLFACQAADRSNDAADKSADAANRTAEIAQREEAASRRPELTDVPARPPSERPLGLRAFEGAGGGCHT